MTATQSAKAWGAARAYELIDEMRDLAFDYAAEFDADPEKYLADALRGVAQTLNAQRPKQHVRSTR